ncbi:MAG: beta strand repeat-containing protein [Gemmatimonadales bacterium]
MRLFRRHIGRLGLGLAAALGTACGSSGGDGGTNPGDNPAIAISISKSSLTIQQGGSDNLTATITRSGGFTGNVNIVTEGAPAGVTAAASNVATSGGTTTGTITVSVAASAAPGTYNLTVRASGSGVSDKTQALTLTITAAPVAGIAISVSPVTVNANQGASGTATVTITRTAFTGAVTLAAEGAPAGVTAAFAPNGTTGTTSTLTLQVGAAVAVGNYNLTLRGTGTGVSDATTPIQLTVAAAPAFAISTIAPSPLNVTQGQQGTAEVTLTRTNFTGAVTLSLDNPPAGVTGTFAPPAPTGTTSTLTVQVAGSVAPGNYQLTVKGTGTGVSDQTKTFTVAVAAGVSGNYTITTTPATSVSLQQGASTNVTVNVNRTGGFAGTVNLAVTGAPAGLTATLNPTAVTGNSSTLSLQAAGGLATGAIQLTLTGTATGLANQTQNLTVNVTAPSGGGNVSLDFSTCDLSDRPIWLAYQDGTGPWTRVVGTGNVYSFDINQSKGGVAFVFDAGSGAFGTTIQYYSRTEFLAVPAGTFCSPAATTKNLSATVANLSLGQLAMVSLGGGSGSAFASGPVTISGVRNGTFDLFAYARSVLTPGSGDRMVIRRGINTAALAEGASIGAPIDFGAGSLVPAAASITITNPGAGETIIHGMQALSGASCDVGTLYAGAEAAGATFTAYGIPGASMVAGDGHGLSVIGTTGTSAFRSLLRYTGALTGGNVTLPTAFPAVTPTAVGGAPYKRLQFSYTLPADIQSSTAVSWTDAGNAKVVSIGASVAGYFGSGSIQFEMPDFSGLSGWDNSWVPATGATVNWTATGAGASITSPCLGGTIGTSSRLGTN